MGDIEKNEQYTYEILTSINNLLKSEEEQTYCHIEFKELTKGDNLTQFFIGYLKAGTVIFNKFTGQDKNNLEFTHILNQLCVQDLLEKKNPELLKED